MSDTPTRDEFNALVSRLEAVEQENSQLQSRVDSLENRVDHYRDQLGSQQSTESDFGDWRDRRVLDRLEVGDKYRSANLRAMYEEVVGMTNDDRIKERVKRLAKSDLFENVDHALFRYVGESA